MPTGAYKHKAIPPDVRRKISLALKGPRSPRFKGQRIHNGYVLVYQPDNPRADKMQGYMKRAEIVMEKMIGRSLSTDELDDHKNRIRDDDHPENLRLFPNTNRHTSFHRRQGDIQPPKINRGQFKKGFDCRRFANRFPRTETTAGSSELTAEQ